MTKYRYERKYVVPEILRKDVLINLKAHPLLFKEIYYERTINNIYFDTPDLDNYLENIDGIPVRYKVRIRWYEDDITKSYLEIKFKRGVVNTKKAVRLQNFNTDSNIGESYLKVIAQADIPGDAKVELNRLVPVCANRYKRRYFVSHDKNFRVTLDYDLRFKRMLSSKVVGLPKSRSKHMVIEVKFDHNNEANLSSFTKSFPFRVGKFSKYTAGVEAI